MRSISGHQRRAPTVSKISWRSSPACGARPPARSSTSPARCTASPTRPAFRNQCRTGYRSSWAAAVRSAHQRLPLATPTSSTCRSNRCPHSSNSVTVSRPPAQQPTGPRPIRYSAALVVCTAASEADVERRAAAIGRSPAQLREDGAAGSPGETAATIRSFADAGAARVYLQVLDLADLDHLDFIANEVAPLLA